MNEIVNEIMSLFGVLSYLCLKGFPARAASALNSASTSASFVALIQNFSVKPFSGFL